MSPLPDGITAEPTEIRVCDNGTWIGTVEPFGLGPSHGWTLWKATRKWRRGEIAGGKVVRNPEHQLGAWPSRDAAVDAIVRYARQHGVEGKEPRR